MQSVTRSPIGKLIVLIQLQARLANMRRSSGFFCNANHVTTFLVFFYICVFAGTGCEIITFVVWRCLTFCCHLTSQYCNIAMNTLV